MHTHIFIYTWILVQGRNLMGQEIQRIKPYSRQLAQQPSWEINLSSLILFRAMFTYFCCNSYNCREGKGKEWQFPFTLQFQHKVKGHFQSACTFSALRSLCFSHWAGSSAAGDVNIQQSII